jgi:HPt (histidine-containing phosphotransfer) domain-containing protein
MKRQVAAATIEPDPGETLDRAHLARMTLGDERLAREVLQLFDRQAANFAARMRQAEPEATYALAHALKGSARGIGAFAVARAAEAVEDAARRPGDCMAALDMFDAALARARHAIAEILQS